MRSATVPFGWIIGCPLLGFVSDRIGRRKPVIIGGAVVLLGCLAWILYGPPDVLPPYMLGLVAGIASGAAMLPYTVIKEANPPQLGGTATGVVNFLNFTFSALLGPSVRLACSRRVRRRGADASSRTTRSTFQPLLYGVALAIVLTLLLKETGPAAARAARTRAAETQRWHNRNRKVRETARALHEARADPDRGRASRARRPRWRARSRPREQGLIMPILVGPADKIRATREGSTASSSATSRSSMRRTATRPPPRRCELVREGKAELLMKGSLHTDELLGAVVARETGLRTGRRISHVFLMDVPTYHKPLIVTDAAINIAPTLEDKVDICQNAIDLAHRARASRSRRSRSSRPSRP